MCSPAPARLLFACTIIAEAAGNGNRFLIIICQKDCALQDIFLSPAGIMDDWKQHCQDGTLTDDRISLVCPDVLDALNKRQPFSSTFRARWAPMRTGSSVMP